MKTMTKTSYGDEARTLIKSGVDEVARAVQITLGPGGRTVFIKSDHDIIPTKDGVTVARSIKPEDPVESVGAAAVQEAAGKTNEQGGDGTTVTTILTRALVSGGFGALASGASPVFLKRGLQKALDQVLAYLEKIATPLKTFEQIKAVASISANDVEMGTHIANLFNKVGKEGVIVVEESSRAGYEEEMVEGMKWDKGMMSTWMVTEPERRRSVLPLPKDNTDVPILVVDTQIEDENELKPIMERLAVLNNRKLLIVAEEVRNSALMFLLKNGQVGAFYGVAVKSPYAGHSKLENLEDLCALTGAKLIAKEKGMKLEEVQLSDLGHARTVIVTQTSTLIVDGKGKKSDIKKRVFMIRNDLRDPKKQQEWEQQKLKERLGRLVGGVAILRSGAESESQNREMKYRIEDSVNATRHAMEDGIVPGGEVAILDAALHLKLDLTGDEALGVEILKQALTQPMKIIAENAGYSGNEVVKNVSEGLKKSKNYGFDAATGEYGNMMEKGIIDPLKVVKAAVRNAVAAVGLLLTGEAVVVEQKLDKEPKNQI